MLEVGIVVFNKVEELDFIGPFETISYLNKLHPNAVTVKLVAESLNPVRAFNGLNFIPDATFCCEHQYDIVIVPGGAGRKQAMFNKSILDFIKRQAPQAKYICSVCTGAFILAETGLVDGLTATTHYTALEELAANYKNITVLPKRVIKNDKYWFAAGISSGIDLSLELIKEIFSEKDQMEIAQRLEYTPQI